MSKGRRNHGSKEFSEVQRIRKEIEKLKRENASLRKQLSRVDINRYNDIQELVNQNEMEERNQASRSKNLAYLKEKWKCFKCGVGFLKIFLLPRRDGVFYFRRCSTKSCPHRTKAQKYTTEIEGIQEEDVEES